MRRYEDDLQILETLIPSENGLTVFDAETQETSYGICSLDGLPYIFDTHRRGDRFVATIELLTEIVKPVSISRDHLDRFCDDARANGLLPIPYSACFFRGNLHVYSFSGPVRGFDLSAVGLSATSSERKLTEGTKAVWRQVPRVIRFAQRGLLEGHRAVRHADDLEVLMRRWKGAARSSGRGLKPRRSVRVQDSSRL